MLCTGFCCQRYPASRVAAPFAGHLAIAIGRFCWLHRGSLEGVVCHSLAKMYFSGAWKENCLFLWLCRSSLSWCPQMRAMCCGFRLACLAVPINESYFGPGDDRSTGRSENTAFPCARRRPIQQYSTSGFFYAFSLYRGGGVLAASIESWSRLGRLLLSNGRSFVRHAVMSCQVMSSFLGDSRDGHKARLRFWSSLV